MCQSNVQSHQGRGTDSTHLQPDKQNMYHNYIDNFFWGILCRHKGFFKRPHIWNCPQCQVQVKFHPRFPYQCICFYFCLSCLPLSLYNTRSDETGGVPRLGSGMIGPTSLLHSRHWVLFASIFFVPFKSNYHSDQLSPWLIITLTNYHSD